MSLYASYLAERTSQLILEKNEGFATYQMNGDECYIIDIYVLPQQRNTGLASRMADEIQAIAKERGCKWLVGSVCPSAKGATDSLKVIMAYGFRLTKSEPNMIWFSKEIQ